MSRRVEASSSHLGRDRLTLRIHIHTWDRRGKLDFLGLAQPIAGGHYGLGNVGDIRWREGLINQRLSVAHFGAKPRPGADPVNLALDQTLRFARIRQLKDLKLDARRTGIDNEDRVDSASNRRQCCLAPPRRGVKNGCRA